MPPPWPPSVKLGRMMSGKAPIASAAALASSSLFTVLDWGDVRADLDHGLLEKLAVLALRDRIGLRADHLDPVLG